MKLKILIILTISIFLILFSTNLYSQALGDVNNDSNVDIIDALLTSQYYVGLNPTGFYSDKADVNCDSSTDIIDALLIAQLYVGLINEFSCNGKTSGPTATPAATPIPTAIEQGRYNYGEALGP